MVNIKQITNYDLAGGGSPMSIHKYGQDPAISYNYYTIPFSTKISKLGYCCEVKGIAYPIFLTINGSEAEFQIGKTGMFEFQPETWKNVNEDSTERTVEVTCTQIRVPADIKFTLDYCYDI